MTDSPLNTVEHYANLRGILFRSLSRFRLQNAQATADALSEARGELAYLRDLTQGHDEAAYWAVVDVTFEALYLAILWAAGTLRSDPGATPLLSTAKAKARVGLELLEDEELNGSYQLGPLRTALTNIEVLDRIANLEKICATLAALAFPILLNAKSYWRRGLPADRSAAKPPPSPSVVRVAFLIDDQPWSSPQLLRPRTLYDIAARLRVSRWPEWSQTLKLTVVSTLDRSQFSMTPLTLDVATGTEGKVHGHLSFAVSQSRLTNPIDLRVVASFEAEGHQPEIVRVVGYHHLRALVLDSGGTPLLSPYRALDRRLLDLIEQLERELPGVDPVDMTDFVRALSAVSTFAGIALQDALYKDKKHVSESEFQSDLRTFLRGMFGDAITEGTRQSGGPTDLKLGRIVVELKVERKIPDRRKSIEKYLSQVAQYCAGEGSQLGVLCILDLTDKNTPPAPPQNSVTLEAPPLHGFTTAPAPFPLRIGTVVVEGNLRSPSDFSS